MTTPAQKFLSERIILGPLETLEKEYDFQPDQIMAVSLDAISGEGIWFYPRGVGGGGGLPLLTQGPLIFPGVSDNQYLRIESKEALTRRLLLTAQRGYPLAAIQTPTVVAKPLSATIQSEAEWTGGTDTADFVRTYLHIGRYLYLFIVAVEASYGATNLSVGGVTLAGIPGTRLVYGHAAQSYYTVDTSIWLVDTIGNGIMNIGVDFAPSGPGGESSWYMKALSFADGIRPGQVDSGAVNGAYPGSAIGTNLDLLGDNAASTIYCLAGGLSGVLPTEITGAYPWLTPGSFWASTYMGSKRLGAGQALFQHRNANGMNIAAAAVEITVS